MISAVLRVSVGRCTRREGTQGAVTELVPGRVQQFSTRAFTYAQATYEHGYVMLNSFHVRSHGGCSGECLQRQ